jgi:hypothetical protein
LGKNFIATLDAKRTQQGSKGDKKEMLSPADLFAF